MLNSSQNLLFAATSAICITSDKPISVIQITQNSNCNGFSGADASLLVLNANNQNITNATFNTIELGNLGVHYINVIMKTADKAQLRMNGRTTDNGGNSLQSYFFVAQFIFCNNWNADVTQGVISTIGKQTVSNCRCITE